MGTIADKVMPRGVTILASATFSADMAENLVTMFEQIGANEVIEVKFSNKGVWAVTPQGMRLFLGSTEEFSVGGGDEAPKVQ